MDIKELEEKILILNCEIKKILDENEYMKNHNLDNIRYDKNNANDCMLFDEFSSIFTHFDYINSVLTYLQKPIRQQDIIKSYKCGKYILGDIEIETGNVVEILKLDEATKTYYWRPTLLKANSNIEGERVRIRG